MRVRLAVKRPPVYNLVRSNFSWPDHIARTFVTAALITWLKPGTIADPACGDASILDAAYRLNPFSLAYLSDISAPQMKSLNPIFDHRSFTGDVYEGMAQFDHVDLIVLTEILEHLEDPDALLRLARFKGTSLIVSSPIGDPEHGLNEEHLWAWDEIGYEEMLRGAQWTPVAKTLLTFPGINGNSQIWVAQ